MLPVDQLGGTALPLHWHTRATDLRTKLTSLAALDTPESRWAANHVRRELAH